MGCIEVLIICTFPSTFSSVSVEYFILNVNLLISSCREIKDRSAGRDVSPPANFVRLV